MNPQGLTNSLGQRCPCERCRKIRDDTRRTIKAIPYALVVPVLVLMLSSAVTANGSYLKYTLLWNLFHPVVLLGALIVSILALMLLKHFVDGTATRWTALVLCVIGFTLLKEIFLPVSLSH